MKHYLNKIKRAWRKGDIINLLWYTIPPLSACLIMLLFTVWIFVKIFQLLANNVDTILGCGIVLIGAVVYLKNSSKISSAVSEEKHFPFEESTDTVHDSLSTNYEIIGNVVYQIARHYYALLKIRKPERQEDIESTTRTKCMGKIVLYEYILYKASDYDVNTIRLLFEHFINKKLKNNNLVGFNNSHYIYNGKAHPILQVHSIENCSGYYRLLMVLTTKEYCEYVHNTIDSDLTSGVEERIIYDNDF